MRVLVALFLLGFTLKAVPQVVEAEYFFDDAIVPYGQGISLVVPANSGNVDITADLPVAGLSEGIHQVFFRVKDVVRGWSPLTPKAFIKLNQGEVFVGFRYGFDAQTDVNTWTYQSFPSPSANVTITTDIDLGTLPKGIHYFQAMARSSSGIWSPISGGTFFNIYSEPLNITALEYYFEDESGVIGTLFTADNFTPSPNVTLDSVTFSIPAGSLVNLKKYFVYIRGINEVGEKGQFMKDTIVYHVSTTGIKDLIQITPKILVFPNPVSEIVSMKFIPLENQGDLIIRIFNETGRTETEKEFSFNEADNYSVDISDLTAGIYRIVIYTKSGKPVARATFVKQ